MRNLGFLDSLDLWNRWLLGLLDPWNPWILELLLSRGPSKTGCHQFGGRDDSVVKSRGSLVGGHGFEPRFRHHWFGIFLARFLAPFLVPLLPKPVGGPGHDIGLT